MLMAAITSLVTMVILVSFNQATRIQISDEAATASKLQAELLSESALLYGRTQIVQNPAWEGMKGKWVSLGESGKFRVDRLETGDPRVVQLHMTGLSGKAKAEHKTEIHLAQLTANDILDLSRVALASFGGDIRLRDVSVYGDAVLVDELSGVKDYDPATMDWKQPSIRDPKVNNRGLAVQGTLYSVNGIGSSDPSQQIGLITDPIYMPGWNLDPYLEHGEDRIIVTDPELHGVRTEKTVVMVVPPKERITITDCDLHGGLVIYSEPDFDYRGKPRNSVDIENSVFARPGATGLGSSLGIHEGIGLIAPGGELKNVRNTASKGIFFMHSVMNLRSTHIEGAIYAVNGIRNFSKLSLEKDVDNTFHYYYGSIPGMILPESRIDIVRIWEIYGAPAADAYGDPPSTGGGFGE